MSDSADKIGDLSRRSRYFSVFLGGSGIWSQKYGAGTGKNADSQLLVSAAVFLGKFGFDGSPGSPTRPPGELAMTA
jgi:hypothetical protein